MVKVTYILSVNISKMVTDRANITITIRYEVIYGLSINPLAVEFFLLPSNWHGFLHTLTWHRCFLS